MDIVRQVQFKLHIKQILRIIQILMKQWKVQKLFSKKLLNSSQIKPENDEKNEKNFNEQFKLMSRLNINVHSHEQRSIFRVINIIARRNM